VLKKFKYVPFLPINTSGKISIDALKTVPLAQENEMVSARSLSKNKIRVTKVFRRTIMRNSSSLLLQADIIYEKASNNFIKFQEILDSLQEEFGTHIRIKDFYQNSRTIESLARLVTK
jgi:hypothetical protein